MYLWRGFPMVAVTVSDGETHRQIHLAKSTLETLCGISNKRVVDEHVATGWPDCEECIQYTRKLLM